MSWPSGFQVSDSERPVYTALTTACQIGIRGGARSVKLRGGSIKQNINFKGTVSQKIWRDEGKGP
jgi:hypothetical protein